MTKQLFLRTTDAEGTRNPLGHVRYHLRDAVDSLVVALYKDNPTKKNVHLEFARNSIAKALMPDAKEMPYSAGEEWLVDLIATAITDSTDLDCTSESQARHIVDVLFRNLKPEAA